MFKTCKILCCWLALGWQPALAAELALDANPYFKTPDELKQYLIENSDLGGTIDDLEVEPGPKGAWRLKLVEQHREVDEDGNRRSDSAAVLMDYYYEGNKIVGGTGRMAGIVFCSDKSAYRCYSMPRVSQEQQGRAAIIARYFVKDRTPMLITDTHDQALVEFNAGKKGEAAKTSLPLAKSAPWKVVPIAADNVESYNDLGFFLAEGGKYKEAAQVLEEVTRAVPDRTAAYLNLGDAYVGLSDTPRAKAAYKQYQKLMQQSGNAAKIPKRIQKYL